MKYIAIMVAIAAFMSFAIATDGDVEHSAEPSSDAHLEHVFKPATAQPGTTVVIIGVQAGGNYIPFWGGNYDACRFMTLYLQSEIDVLGKIVTLSFMPWSSATGNFDNVRVNLCHTSATELSTTFDNNYTGNTPVEVMNVGSLLVGGPADVWMDWDIDFDYNNTDNLLVEILWNGDAGVSVPIWRTNETVPRRLYAWDDMATTGTVGNQCYYVKLAISTGPPPDHDVGVVSIDAPGLNLMPNTTLDPTATYRNFGTYQETFDVYYLIDSAGVNIYNETANITLAATTDTMISFASWTCGPNGAVYDVTAYTVLAGDVNPANDTLSQTTTVIASFWESFAAMPGARSGPYAGWFLDGSGVLTVHVFGGNPGPVSDHYIWDHASNSWSTGTALPAAANYGGHVTVGERIYMIGARQAPGEGLITIYDTPSDVYTTVNLPGTIGDPACAVKDNNLIYIVGGCRPTGWTATTIVMLYDIAADTFWTAVTQLPGATARTCAAAAIIGDTIYVAGGIDGGGSYTNQFVVGYIDPSNPANITWGTGIDKPGSTVYRLNGGPVFDDAGNGVFYIAGGDPFTTETYAYTPGSGWTTCSNKITACSNWGCAIAPSPITDDAEWIMYAAGGYSPYYSVFEGYHTGTVTGIKEMPNEQINAFSFKITSPNPISSRASFAFSMPHRGEVTFSIYDVSGRKVLDSSYSNVSQGEHTLFWDLKDNAYRNVASGIYFYRMETGTYYAEGKLVVVR